MSDVKGLWAVGSTYEDFMGRWSRRVAPKFISWLRIRRGLHWLDIGCGTGALTSAVCSHAGPASVVGCDPSTAFIEFARERTRDHRASFVAVGVGGLPPRPAGYGSVSSMFTLNFLPEPEKAIHEMKSVAAPRSTVSACVWDYSEKMQFLRHFWNAAVVEDSAAAAFDEGNRFPICRPDSLEALFCSCGLVDVRCEAIEINTMFRSFDDYWRPFLGGTGPAPSYVASLDAGRRVILARKLEKRLPRDRDGKINLIARAWVVRGTVNE